MEVVAAAYECRACEVEGRSFSDPPVCWCCDSEDITVTARPTVIIED